jgi:Flp pilus assembly pilin Flp
MSKKSPKTFSSASALRPTLALLRSRLATDEEGATAIEYALIACGIGAAVAATVWSLGSTTNGFYASLAALMP